MEMKTVIIRNATIYTGEQVLNQGSLIISGGKIQGLFPDEPVPVQDCHVIDATGLLAIPGLIDLHFHGYGEFAITETTALSRLLVSQGVTGFLPTLMTGNPEFVISALHLLAATHGAGDGARILGINLEGPFLNPEQSGAQPRHCLMKPDPREASRLLEAGGNMVRLMTIAPELPGALDIIEFLHLNGVIPAAGHSQATCAEMLAAEDRGLCHVTHLFNRSGSFHHREPGLIGWALTRGQVTVELIPEHHHLHPLAVELTLRCKSPDRVILVSDNVPHNLRDSVLSENGAVMSPDRTLLGSAQSLLQGVFWLVDTLGIDLGFGLRLASLNPARLLGIENRKGSLEPGKDADLVLLRGRTPVLTMVEGKMVYDQLSAR